MSQTGGRGCEPASDIPFGVVADRRSGNCRPGGPGGPIDGRRSRQRAADNPRRSWGSDANQPLARGGPTSGPAKNRRPLQLIHQKASAPLRICRMRLRPGYGRCPRGFGMSAACTDYPTPPNGCVGAGLKEAAFDGMELTLQAGEVAQFLETERKTDCRSPMQDVVRSSQSRFMDEIPD